MNNDLVLEVIEGHHFPESRQQGETIRWSQKVYAHNGGPFPVECRMSIPDHSKAIEPGKYTLDPKAYRAGKWGDLEINTFDMWQYLVPVRVAAPVNTPSQQKKAG